MWNNHFKYDFHSPSSPSVKPSSERGQSEVGRDGSRSDRGRGKYAGRGKNTGRGGKREPKVIEPKKYEEPEVKVRCCTVCHRQFA